MKKQKFLDVNVINLVQFADVFALAVNVIIIWVLDSEETKVFECYRILAENVINLDFRQ